MFVNGQCRVNCDVFLVTSFMFLSTDFYCVSNKIGSFVYVILTREILSLP